MLGMYILLTNKRIMVQYAARPEFFLLHSVQIDSGVLQVSYSVSFRTFWSVSKRPGREVNQQFSPSAEIKNAWSCVSNPPYVFVAWSLVKHVTLIC
jgi:hypothetical protein